MRFSIIGYVIYQMTHHFFLGKIIKKVPALLQTL